MTQNILFVCTGNSCRSVMAEGLFKKAMQSRQKDFVVGSAGVAAPDGMASTQETIRAMKRAGVDMSGHRSRRLTQSLVETADKIYVMEKFHELLILNSWPQAKNKVHLLMEYSPERIPGMEPDDVPDPIQTSDEYYGQILKVVEGCIENIVKTL